MSEGLEWGRHAPQKERNESYNQRRGKNFLRDSGEAAQSHDANSCEEWGPVSPARAGATYKLRTAGNKGSPQLKESSPHTHTPGAQAQKKHLNNKYQQQWLCDSCAQSRGLPKPAGNLIPNMQMGTLRKARPGQGWRSSSCSSNLPVP